ncbi:hypothetical protein MT418_000342 [Batrachochytrium dendrobatidis]
MGAAESSISANYRLFTPDGNPTTVNAQYGAGSGTQRLSDNDHEATSNSSTLATALLSRSLLLKGVHKTSGAVVSIFQMQLSKSSQPGMTESNSSNRSGGGQANGQDATRQGAPGKPTGSTVLPDGINKLKTIRHPGIIKFITAESKGSSVLIVTEFVLKIADVLPTMSEEEICLGIYNILKTIEFLHHSGISHNSLGIDSIYLTGDRRWVIGNMEFVRNIDQMTPEFIASLNSILPQNQAGLDNPTLCHKDTLVFSRDCVAMGYLISDLIKSYIQHDVSTLVEHRFPWDKLEESAAHLRSNSTTSQLSIKKVLDTPFFKDSMLIEIVERFLKDIRAIHPENKAKMFSGLYAQLHCLSQGTVNDFLLPKLLNHELFVEPGAANFFMELLTPTTSFSLGLSGMESLSVITKEAFSAHIVPFIHKTFTVRQYETRILLLKMLDRYIDFVCDVDELILKNTIIPELIIGMSDADDLIYLESVCGLAKCIPRYYQSITERKRHVDMDVSSATPNDSSEKHSQRGNRSLSLQSARSNTANVDSLGSNEEGRLHFPASQKTTSFPRSESVDMDGSPEFSMQYLVEDMLIPHTLRICIYENTDVKDLWCLLDHLSNVWKRLIVFSEKNKYNTPDISSIIRSLFKCLHLIMRILPVDQKIDYFCNRLCGGLDSVNDTSASAILWIPKLIELSIPFLRDDNRDVRRHVSLTVMKLLTIISTAFERAPTISRKREQTSLTTRLLSVYGQNTRVSLAFPKSGPRQLVHAGNHHNTSMLAKDQPEATHQTFSTLPYSASSHHEELQADYSAMPEVEPAKLNGNDLTRDLLGKVMVATSLDETLNPSSETSALAENTFKSEDGWNSDWGEELDNGLSATSNPVTEDIQIQLTEGMQAQSTEKATPFVNSNDVGFPIASVTNESNPKLLSIKPNLDIPIAADNSQSSMSTSIASPVLSAISTNSIHALPCDTMQTNESATNVSRGKFFKRDQIKQKRQEKLAENIYRQSTSPTLNVQPNPLDQVGKSLFSSTASKAATVYVPVVVEKPVEVDYFKDMAPVHVRKQSILAAAAATVFPMTKRTSDSAHSDSVSQSNFPSDPVPSNRMAFHGSNADFNEPSLGWGEEFDEDIDLNDIRL